MLYLYSCTSVKLGRVEENDDIKIVINFNPFYPFEYLIKTLPSRRYKEESQNQNTQSRYEGLKERIQNNNPVEHNETDNY